jgi:nucleotide-binding universal stress UspA family protein
MTVSYQRILVPLDGSELAAGAIPHAEALATLAKARLVLLQVVPSTAMLVSETAAASPSLGLPTVDPLVSSGQLETIEEAITTEANTILGEAAAALRAKSLQVDTVILQGAPADAILTYAKNEQIDLIVMATHGRTGLARALFGSVAESVLHHAACPVLLIRVATS